MNAQNLNKQLKDLYSEFLPKFVGSFNETELQELSLPLLMHVFSEYVKAKVKILFVGQETFGWGGKLNDSDKLNTSSLTELYKKFKFAIDSKKRNSPFWRFLHDFNNKMNPNGNEGGFLWTNLSKTDHNKTTPKKELQCKAISGYLLLREELKIIKPDIVIFLTSWKYDNMLREIFPNVEFDIIKPRFLTQLKHNDLPILTFRTYHPAYLNRSKNFEEILVELVNRCS